MFLLNFVSRFVGILPPLILKSIITAITCDEGTTTLADGCPDAQYVYLLIVAYACLKFASDFLNYIREIPFSYISANAEKHIAKEVYSHIQNQSLAFHLSRETGKIIRIVSKGSQSFAQVLRYQFFSLLPIMTEIIFIIAAIGVLYGLKFFWIVFGTVFLYLVVTFVVTEWRAKYFKRMAKADATYVQRATDSLLNFETVKYFNAEDHEQRRFSTSLAVYKEENVKVAKTLVTLNMAQALVIVFGLGLTLVIAYMSILAGELNISDFVVFNQYILQVYFPLGFLGTFWRFIRQSWSDIELVLDILSQDETIKESQNPD
mmetsp:Transcript_11579/g.19564  ORF Transcript_11579/g.19564 Transcript_11579/m.19564 type:complete len:318 (+) Transcript_11579:279-1232(+)